MDTNRKKTFLNIIKTKIQEGGIARSSIKMQTSLLDCGCFYKPITRMAMNIEGLIERKDK